MIARWVVTLYQVRSLPKSGRVRERNQFMMRRGEIGYIRISTYSLTTSIRI